MTDKKPAEIVAVQAQSEMPEDRLGERIKQVRERLGLTHDGLSNLTKIADLESRGISRTTIRGYELGTYKPGSREIRILSAALKKTPSWLLMGDEFGGQDSEEEHSDKTGRRWADVVFPVIAMLQLGRDEKKQIAELVETLLRLKIGEVQFRSMKGFIEEFSDTIQDTLRDRNQYRTDPEEMRAVFMDVVADMKKRHGEAQGELLMATLIPVFQFWEASHK